MEPKGGIIGMWNGGTQALTSIGKAAPKVINFTSENFNLIFYGSIALVVGIIIIKVF